MMDDAHRARRKETALPLSCRPHSADLAAKLAVPEFKKTREHSADRGHLDKEGKRNMEQITRRSMGRWYVLVLISLMYLITYLDRVNISTAAPVISKEFGFDKIRWA